MQLSIEYSWTFIWYVRVKQWPVFVSSRLFSLPSCLPSHLRIIIIRFDAIFCPPLHIFRIFFLLSLFGLFFFRFCVVVGACWHIHTHRHTAHSNCKHVSDGINHTYAKIKGTGMAITNDRYYLHPTKSTLDDAFVWRRRRHRRCMGVCVRVCAKWQGLPYAYVCEYVVRVCMCVCVRCRVVLVLFIYSRFENKMHAILLLFHEKILFRLLLFSLASSQMVWFDTDIHIHISYRGMYLQSAPSDIGGNGGGGKWRQAVVARNMTGSTSMMSVTVTIDSLVLMYSILTNGRTRQSTQTNRVVTIAYTKTMKNICCPVSTIIHRRTHSRSYLICNDNDDGHWYWWDVDIC